MPLNVSIADPAQSPSLTDSNEPALPMKFIGALVGSSLAGAYGIGGVGFMDFATSFTGGLGAAAGYTVGCFLANRDDNDAKSPLTTLRDSGSPDYKMVYPILGAVIVPSVAAGTIDTDVAILAAGAFAGAYLVNYYYSKQ